MKSQKCGSFRGGYFVFSMLLLVGEARAEIGYLAGRAAVLDLHTLSIQELEGWSGKKANSDQLIEWMFQGGYPELHAKRPRR